METLDFWAPTFSLSHASAFLISPTQVADLDPAENWLGRIRWNLYDLQHCWRLRSSYVKDVGTGLSQALSLCCPLGQLPPKWISSTLIANPAFLPHSHFSMLPGSWIPEFLTHGQAHLTQDLTLPLIQFVSSLTVGFPASSSFPLQFVFWLPDSSFWIIALIQPCSSPNTSNSSLFIEQWFSVWTAVP